MNSQPAHILILEDHPTHQRVIAFNLSSAGFRVTTAGEAADALLLAKQTQFDLVITDYYLPDYPGTDFVKLLREIDGYGRIPVIMLTGRSDELNIERLRKDLLLLVLSKPCSIDRLLDTVSKCLEVAPCES